MTIDHYAIAAQLCLNRACKDPGPCPDLEAAYLDLHDEVQRLRADLRHVIDERDATFALMLARAEKAEAERDALRAAASSDYCAGFDAGFAASHENWNAETINRSDQRERDYLDNQRAAALATYRTTKEQTK